MFSLVLIDDEYWALRGIRDYIDWESYGFSDIRCFDSPTAALEHILKAEPDAVFTDIRMPPITGLDIMERCREQGLATRFVVVSAYAEFEYARRALESGAFSYILKPLNRKELNEVAGRLSEQLRTDRSARLTKYLRTLVIRTLAGRAAAPADVPEELEGLTDGRYRVCAAASVPPAGPGIWIGVYEDLAVGIVPESYVPSDRNMGLSTVAEDLGDAYGRFREALVAYYTVLFYGIRGHLEYHGTELGVRDMAELREAVQAKKYAQVRSLLQAAFLRAREKRIMLDGITLFYNDFLLQTLAARDEKDLMRDLRPFSDCFQLFGVLHDLETVQGCLLTLADGLSDEAQTAEDPTDVIRTVIRYVEENYTQNITLEGLAQKYYISVSYLSRRFKNVTGENFSEFLIRRRIDHACQLLSTTGLSVAEIGTVCGYPDCFYFSRIFKKVMGMPPSRYREQDDG